MKKIRKSVVSILFGSILVTLAAQDYTPMIDNLEKVLASGAITNKEEKIELLLDLSHAYLRVDTAKCKAYAMEVLKMAQNSGSKLAEANAYNALGNFYKRTLSYYHAHSYYIKAEKILLEIDNKERLYSVYKNMLSLFAGLKDDDNTIYYANKVLIMAVERNDYIWMLRAQLNIGDVRYRDDKGEKALDYFLNLYQSALQMKDSLDMYRALSCDVGTRCANIYHNTNRSHEALPYLYQMLSYFESRGIKIDVGTAYDNLAIVYAEMHNIDSAEYYINKGFAHSTINKELFRLYHASSIVDSLKGNYLSALANFQKYHQIKDSLSKEEKTTEMSRLKVWHEFDQKEIENRILQQEFQKQRKLTMILAIALVMILALLALAVFFYRKIIENNRKLNEKNREITEKNCELEELHTVKNKLFSVVAHDLRNPIAALMSILKLTHMNILDAETQAQMLKDVSKRVDNVHGLLDNLLHWAKSQMQGIVISPVYFDIQNEICTVVDGLQDIAAAKKIVLSSLTEKYEIYADRDMFSIVMRNLTSNALKYTSAGGEVIIDSELLDNMVVISVKDTGTGMSQEVQNKLFNLSETRSRRGTNNESGTGLGLVLCADFVKANGGDIWFTSVQGEGSTFFFSVPVKS